MKKGMVLLFVAIVSLSLASCKKKTTPIELTTTTEDLVMVVGDVKDISVETNDKKGVTYTVSNPSLLEVDENGKVTAIAHGTTEIIITSNTDQKESLTIKVTIHKDVVISLEHDTIMVMVGSTKESQVTSTDPLVYKSSNDDVFSVDEQGLITGMSSGTAQLEITTTLNPNVKKEMTIVVEDIPNSLDNNVFLVDHNVTEETVVYNEMTYLKGYSLFSSIEEALLSAKEHTVITVLEGNYNDDLVIEESITLVSENATISGKLTVKADDVVVRGFSFEGSGSILNEGHIKGLVVEVNTFKDTMYTSISLNHVSFVTITNNVINGSQTAISIENFIDGDFVISKNTITDVDNAVVIKAGSEYALETTFKVERNTIDQVGLGVSFDLRYGDLQKEIFAYVRFNTISNATVLAKQSENSDVDFTLNYWGSEIPNYDKFENINDYQLRGYYSLASSIISENAYNPLVPILIEILNPIDELEIGEEYQLEFSLLPRETDPSRMRWITSNPNTISLSNGKITPTKSGEVTVTLRSSIDIRVKTTMDLKVMTTPGVELSLDEPLNQLTPGKTLKLNAYAFPYTIASEELVYESSDPSVASISNDGMIQTHQAGVVTFKVSLLSDETLFQSLTAEVYESLSEDNVMDALTMSMVMYSTPHEWTVYGVGFNYIDHKYESVSRYLFDDLAVNTSKMLPVSSGIRPGVKKTELSESVRYNEENVHWVVVHETANTNPGGGALSHANYLWNAAVNGTVLDTSWHYTMDDKELYQHVPLDEIAYHAGDGRSTPGKNGIYLGGGNRNGIGIETSVAQDGDNYRVWQRTAKLTADLLVSYNLPLAHMRYHQDFSGKVCPQSLIRGGLIPLFEELAYYEYLIEKNFSDYSISFESHDTDYVDHSGRVINMPDRGLSVSYTVTVSNGSTNQSRTFYTYLPGTVH